MQFYNKVKTCLLNEIDEKLKFILCHKLVGVIVNIKYAFNTFRIIAGLMSKNGNLDIALY